MGHASFLAIAAMGILVAALTVNAITSSIATTDGQSRDQQSLQAEEIARSGLDMTVARVSRDFSTWREGFPETVYGGGSFMTAVDGPAEGPVRVYSAGVVDGVDMQLTAWVTKLASAPSAMTVESDSVVVSMPSTATISGVDHNTTGAEGRGQADAARGVWVSSPNAAAAFTGALSSGSPSRVRGVGTSGDVYQAALPGEHDAMIAEAVASATDTYSGDQSFTDQIFGSPGAPAVVVVNGDATFVSGGGTGFLYVKGNFDARADFEWRGIVVTEGEGDLGFSMSGNARILGTSYVIHSDGGSTSTAASMPELNTFPTLSGIGTRTQTVAWPGIGATTVTTTMSAPSSSVLITGSAKGSTLQTFLGMANLNGVDLGATGISNIEYTGPTQMPMLNIRPNVVSSGTSSADVRISWPINLPDGPLYLYVADLDWTTMYLYAYDQLGVAIPTTGWTKSLSIDLIAPDDGKRTTLVTGATNARLVPNNNRDGEIIIDEITIPSVGNIRELRFQWNSPVRTGDVAGLSLSTESVYSTPGVLNLDISGNAQITYSAEEVARLATTFSSIEDRAWVQVYDYHATSQVDRMTLARRGTGAPAASASYAYCLAGDTQTAPSLMGLLAAQLDGATAGACAGGYDPDGDGLVTVCHKPEGSAKQTMAIDLGSVASHLGHGDSIGACTGS